MTESTENQDPAQSSNPGRSKIIIAAGLFFLICCIAFAFWSRTNRGNSPTANNAAQPTQADSTVPTCDGFKVLQASGWFCIPKMGKPYRISGPEKKITGEKSIPRPPAH